MMIYKAHDFRIMSHVEKLKIVKQKLKDNINVDITFETNQASWRTDRGYPSVYVYDGSELACEFDIRGLYPVMVVYAPKYHDGCMNVCRSLHFNDYIKMW